MEHGLAAFKPDFEDARRRWGAFWERSIIDRPICLVRAPKAGVAHLGWPQYLEGFTSDIQQAVDRMVAWAAATYWGGDAVPTYVPSFGPDQFAAFLGAKLQSSPSSPGTNWAEVSLTDWRRALPLKLQSESDVWLRLNDFLRRLADAAAGRVVVAHLDLHSNLDALSALRGPAGLCEDLIDEPELIDEAMASVRQLYAPVYEALFAAGAMGRTGSSGWMQAYCEGKYNVIQCDAICLISPAMARRWVIPALDEESSYLDHCFYHLDGPGALAHLDDLLALPGIDCIQWVPGDGQPPQLEWLDVLKRIQAAGKAVILHLTPAQVKACHKEFDPTRVVYDCYAQNQAEADDLLGWLVRNT